jgi:glycolate oxidase FAD binding subunit
MSLPTSRGAMPAGGADGVAPGRVVRPDRVEALSAALREAAESGQRVLARGSGSKLGWGNPPEVDLVVDLTGLDAVLEHNPGDLVVRAQAGLPLRRLQQILARHRQRLALDPPERAATLGGIVAAAASGPRRHRYGTPRDLLLGATAVLADGTVSRSGGKVVKNVAGYDVGKLLAGSYGTLAVLAELTFRLHPQPADRRVVMLPAADPDDIGEIVQRLLRSTLTPTAVELLDGRVVVLFEGITASVEAQADAAARLTPGAEVAGDLPAGFGEHPWNRDGTGRGDDVAAAAPGPRAAASAADDVGRWRPVAPAAGEDVAAAVREPRAAATVADRVGLKVAAEVVGVPDVLRALDRAGATRVVGRLGVGVLEASLPVGDPDAVAATVERLRADVAPHDGSVVVLQAPPEVKARLDVWGPTRALDLMRRVKDRFDPDHRLSPGRFVGGI